VGDEARDRDDEVELTRVRELILARRNRFMAAAIAGLGMTGCATSSTCLRPNREDAALDDAALDDAAMNSADASPGDMDARVATPDAGGTQTGDAGQSADAAPDARPANDAGPSVCLTPI
jgi:hypothetical protein